MVEMVQIPTTVRRAPTRLHTVRDSRKKRYPYTGANTGWMSRKPAILDTGYLSISEYQIA